MSSLPLQRRHWTEDPGHPVPQIPNPVLCLVLGDVVLFQLQILSHSESWPLTLLPLPG